MFAGNPAKFYLGLKGGNIEVEIGPSVEEIGKYWKSIWGACDDFNSNADWFEDEKRDCENIQ